MKTLYFRKDGATIRHTTSDEEYSTQFYLAQGYEKLSDVEGKAIYDAGIEQANKPPEIPPVVTPPLPPPAVDKVNSRAVELFVLNGWSNADAEEIVNILLNDKEE